MSKNEKIPQEGTGKPFRRNPHLHKPLHNLPGVDKALHLFGVPDLRELLNQKHKEQTYFEANKSDTGNASPCEPSYSYLKDALRESSSAAEDYKGRRHEHKGKQPFDRSKGRGRLQPNTITGQDSHGRQPNTRHRSDNQGQQKQHLPQQCVVQHNNIELPEITKGNKDERNLQGSVAKDSTINQQKTNRQNTKNSQRNQQNLEISNEQYPKRNFTSEHNYIPKENSYQGTTFNSNRGGGSHRNHKPKYSEAIIKSPFNIKVKLSTTSGERSCFIDEANKIPDIIHVSDKRPPTRGRGRGRGRGSQKNWTRDQKKNVNQNKELDEKQSSTEGDNWDENQIIVQTKNQDFEEDQTEQKVKNSNELEETNVESQEFELQQEFKENDGRQLKDEDFDEKQTVQNVRKRKSKKLEKLNVESQDFELQREFKEEEERQLKVESSDKETVDINYIGENYESELVNNFQESFVITATNLEDDENVTRSVELMAQSESKKGTEAVPNQ